MKVVLDENVSKGLAEPLLKMGWTTLSVSADLPPGSDDETVFRFVLQKDAVFVTRDHDFTNPVRFDAGRTRGIVYVRAGNLTSAQEIKLVTDFLGRHEPAKYKGRLVTLYLDGIRLR